ncbi:hypothetical protein CASFOL_031772 [Castilleja foliolosa]|uniref:Endonuclease/exonuclease/phosphatase domain-containing protein n=1 Tax=Castilleja foliolosa TaxID=1961234 RepID=A0ABD3C707_9LAMI
MKKALNQPEKTSIRYPAPLAHPASANHMEILLFLSIALRAQTLKLSLTQRGPRNSSMKMLVWNCQGLAQPKAVRALRFLIRETKADVVFISEVKSPLSPLISNSLKALNFTKSAFSPPIEKSGGLILAWKDNINLTILSTHSNFFHTSILDSNNSWLFTPVYVPCNHIKKNLFWKDIGSLNKNPTLPWLLAGDLNDILDQKEKKGGLSFTSSSTHRLCQDLNDNGLIDLGFTGYPFTWCNKRKGIHNIQQRLDRGVGNDGWISLYPLALVNHLTPVASDHSPITISTTREPRLPTPFKFEEMWLEDNSCIDTVRKSWNIPSVGSPPFKLVTKIKNAKQDLRIWNKENFGNFFKKANELKLKLDAMQYLDKTDSNGILSKKLQEELDSWLLRADIYWRQKAKEKWIKDGDANTRY